MTFLHMFSSFIIMILLLSLLILIHEAGHFFAAKLVGMKVDKFGFGLPFGPTLYKKQVGDMEILVHACLLGGYVSFPDDDENSDLPKDSPLRFSNKSVGARAFVISAGVLCNFILAYVIIFLTGMIWQHLPENSMTVRFAKFAPSAVESVLDAGLKENDILYSVNGTKVVYPITINKYFNLSKEFDGMVDEAIVNKKLEELKALNPEFAEKEVIPTGTKVKLPKFTDENPVELSFDNIIGIAKYENGEITLTDTQKDLRDKINYNEEYTLDTDSTLNDIAFAVSDTKKPISVIVKRDGEEIQLKTFYSNKEGIVGIMQTYEENYAETKNIIDLTKATINYANYNLDLMVYTLGKLFTGKVPMSEMNGIIAIAKIGTEMIAYKGLFNGLLLTAMISLNLALINLLPIPALDGGHLMFLIIEKITGKPVNKVFVEKVSNFFFYLLIFLMLFIIYNDIHAWIIGKI
jgi:regulator of sigma E protease